MAFNNNNSRPMVQGNWKCSECGAEITELPFEPSADRPILCKECWAKKRSSRNRGFSPRKMVQGNWICSGCGAEITELPFEPRPGGEVYCKECWAKKRNDR